ncbi:PEP/pyruvate-binding domain-containing protein [Daejeonella sp.]|uniref:PEP/pyruvate-binding domain-containing protein n=1 Tax=Daejeonella sp. TaxID=2805397 RepID=UPI003783A98D
MIIKDYVLRLKNISIANLLEVGVKNAFLGEIFTHPILHDIRVPDGFAITSTAFHRFIEYNKLDGVHERLIASLDSGNLASVDKIGQRARALILGARMPGDIEDAITAAYRELCFESSNEVAVRSSPIDIDLLKTRFIDVHDTFLNIKGDKELIEAVKKCFASLYSEKSLINHSNSSAKSISVCVQKMVRSNKASSGNAFTSDPESGFADVIHITGVYGILDKDYQSDLHPDEFIVYKPNISEGLKAIIQKKMGQKNQMLIFRDNSVIQQLATPEQWRDQFILMDNEILILAEWGMTLENYYGSPISFEWVKDGDSNELFLLQAKPENFKKSKNQILI